MKGVIVDCKTQTVKEVDDGLPMPDASAYREPAGIDLTALTEKIADIDQLKADIEALKAAKP